MNYYTKYMHYVTLWITETTNHSAYWMADILLWLNVLCEWGRNMCVLLVQDFNGEHFLSHSWTPIEKFSSLQKFTISSPDDPESCYWLKYLLHKSLWHYFACCKNELTSILRKMASWGIKEYYCWKNEQLNRKPKQLKHLKSVILVKFVKISIEFSPFFPFFKIIKLTCKQRKQ